MSASTRLDIVWAIRDARGLTVEEKAFLFVIESRGVYYATRETAMADTGMLKDRFYRIRSTLKSKGLLRVDERPGMPTRYRVDGEAVLACRPRSADAPLDGDDQTRPQIADAGVPDSPTGASVLPGQGVPQRPDQKVTGSGPHKGTTTQEPAAARPGGLKRLPDRDHDDGDVQHTDHREGAEQTINRGPEDGSPRSLLERQTRRQREGDGPQARTPNGGRRFPERI